MIVCCLFLFVCVLISVALFALGNKYATISPSLSWCLCLALLALVYLHLDYRTPFRHPPSMLLPLSPLSSTKDQQDKMHQGFHLGDQLALETFFAASSTKCNPVELCLTLQARNPFIDPSRLHEIPHIGSLTMCLTHKIAREPVKRQ